MADRKSDFDDIMGIRPGTDTVPVALVSTKFDEGAPVISPDGRWLAYTSNESGQYEVFVVPFPNTGATKWAVSSHGGTEARWSHSGRELFYRDGAKNFGSGRGNHQPDVLGWPLNDAFCGRRILAPMNCQYNMPWRPTTGAS